jgi:hypothetical protein
MNRFQRRCKPVFSIFYKNPADHKTRVGANKSNNQSKDGSVVISYNKTIQWYP